MREHPELILPNADNAEISSEKFTSYIFNPCNKTGFAKGKAFTHRLGYSISNWEELKLEIQRNIKNFPAKFRQATPFGNEYEQKMILYGKTNKPTNVIVAWYEKRGRTWLATLYVKEVD